MSTLLVTIVGPEEKVDLAVPGETAIGDLLPTLLEMAGSDPGGAPAGSWSIDVAGGTLPRDRTLSQCGVADGTVLTLRPPPEAEVAEGAAPGVTAEPADTGVRGGPDEAADTAGPGVPEEAAHTAAPGLPGEAADTAAPGGFERTSAGGEPSPPEPPPPTPDAGSVAAPAGDASDSAPGGAPQDAAARRGSPLERTRQALPSRIGPFERIAQASVAAFDGTGEAHADRGRAASGPSTVTVARRTTPFERMRATWRRTDYLRLLDASIVAPRLRQAATIAVVSPKGGVGKTTLTALLGSLLAHTRRDRIVAVDTNPDYGSLGPTLTPDHEVFVDDLLGLLDDPDLTVTQLDANLGRGPDGLMVLPAPTDPQRMARLNRRSYVRVIEYLQTKAGVLMLDCGTGLQEPAAQAAVLTADQLVLVSDAEPATATLVTQASKLLLKSGVPLMVVVNKYSARGARLDIEQLANLLPQAAGMGLVQVNTRAAARVAAGDFTWDEPAGPWEVTLRELASALLSQWAGLGLTVRDPEGGAVGPPER